jgi:hypothetical protein
MNMNNDIDPIIHEFLKRNAKKGGDAIKEKHGKAYFSQLAKKRWADRKKPEQP